MRKGDIKLWGILNEKIDMLRNSGNLVGAIRVAMTALDVARRAFEETDPNLASSIERLAGLHKDSAEYDLAMPLYREGLDLVSRPSPFPIDESTVSRFTANLALTCDLAGDEPGALEWYARSIPMIEQRNGPYNMEVAMLLNNSAMIYKNQARYQEADDNYLRALDIYERLRGPDHPDVAVLLNNMGILYSNMEHYARAEEMHIRAMNIRVRAYGDNHPDVGQSLGNIAVVYHSMNDFRRAAAHYKKALIILEKHLKNDAADYLIVASNFADLLRNAGYKNKASAVLKKAQQVQRS